MSEQITSGEPIDEEIDFEKAIRPATFNEFIGQSEVVRNLKVYIEAAEERGEPVDHIILSGPPGLGKTTLARLIANETDAEFHNTSGPILEKAGDLAGILTNLEFGDVLFIDEIHRLPKDVEEYLYSAMEDFEIDIIIDSGPHARSVSLDLPRYTMIGATTRMGLLASALRSRFGVREKIRYYPPEELKRIIKRAATILNVTISDEAAGEISERARGTPRVANRFLKRIRDLAQLEADNEITEEIARQGLRMLDVDPEGLEETDREIMQMLLDHDGGPCGLKTISAAIGEETGTIEEVHEPFLIRKGFLRKTSRGRELTKKGLSYLGVSPDDDEPSLFSSSSGD